MKKVLFAGAIAVCGMMMMPAESQAGGIRISFGSGCSQGYYGGGFTRSRAYTYPSYSFGSYYRPSQRVSHRRSWHDTSHYDYHPPARVRHGNHHHVIPGHYDLHRTGHWHYGR